MPYDPPTPRTRSSTPEPAVAAGLFDISSDSNVHRHEGGSYECKLCLTVHVNANSYLAHAQGKRHRDNVEQHSTKPVTKPSRAAPKPFKKIGLPQYNIIKIREPQTLRLGIRVELQYPQIKSDLTPQFRFMSAFEQQVEDVDTRYQYVVIAAEPYDTVALRIPAKPVDESSLWTYFDADTKMFTLQFVFQDTSK